jgi:hypothetical protein
MFLIANTMPNAMPAPPANPPAIVRPVNSKSIKTSSYKTCFYLGGSTTVPADRATYITRKEGTTCLLRLKNRERPGTKG